MSLSRTPSSTQETHPIFQTFLNPAERIIWSGKPRQGLLFRPSDIFFVPFSIVWTALAVWWELEKRPERPALSRETVGRCHALCRRLHPLAAFSGRSGLSLPDLLWPHQSARLDPYRFVQNQADQPAAGRPAGNPPRFAKNGWGQIVFGPLAPNAWMQTGGGWIKMDKQASIPAFELLKDPQKIYKQILAQQKKVK